MRKILITNDDGIDAGGIRRLAGAALEFGEVWVVAPLHQRSAASHSITLHDPIDLRPYDFPLPGVHAFSCSGTPADCVRIGCLNVVPEGPDVVLSGINHGYNVASDIQYSATAGAAFEAAFQGTVGIALSEAASDRHEVTDAWLQTVLRRVLAMKPGARQIVNVNFPGCRLPDFQGIKENRTVSASEVFRDHYHVIEDLPGGGMRLMVKGTPCNDAEEDSDFRAILGNYISIGLVNNIMS